MKNLNTAITLEDLIKGSKARMMTVIFRKVSTGEIRVMYCKTGIHTKQKVGAKKRKQNPNVAIVFDCEKKEKRAFRFDSVVELRCGNVIYRKN